MSEVPMSPHASLGRSSAWSPTLIHLVGQRTENGVVMPMVSPTVGRTGFSPRFFVGAYRRQHRRHNHPCVQGYLAHKKPPHPRTLQ